MVFFFMNSFHILRIVCEVRKMLRFGESEFYTILVMWGTIQYLLMFLPKLWR